MQFEKFSGFDRAEVLNCKLKLMKTIIFVLVLLLFYCSCSNQKKENRKKYSFQKIEYKKQNESFDSTFVMNGNKVRLTCNTECFNDFPIADTINDSTIYLYQDRFLKFMLKSNKIDTQIIVTKEIIRNIYNNNLTYNNSVLANPRIEKIDTDANFFLIHSLFLYPFSLDGTNYLEEIIFKLSLEGKVTSVEVLAPPEEPNDSMIINSP